ncbi:NAD(P)-dependent oxidoreductase [Candidatus Pacearchaeota archaeon]|nr:NAD(P)-dependent oxidoreductase [Candidatus Pacearchaeota archaeon]
MKRESVLITGGAGYIGSVLTGHLLDNGFKVTCLDDLRYGQKSLIHYAGNPAFDFVYGDCRNKNLLEEIIGKFDFIIPLAALVGAPICDSKPVEAETINRDAVILIDNLRSRNQQIIFPTTNSGYGTTTGETFCTEETPLNPITLYGRTKVEAEKSLLDSEKGAITMRLATVFGASPRMRTDLLVNDFVLKAVTDRYIVIYEKDFKRNYIHIKDVARAFEHCINNFDVMKNQAYNLGLSDANLSKIELAEKIKEHIPDFEIINGEIGSDPDKRNYIVSNEKIEKTGFKTEFSLDYGIKELVKTYKILLKGNQDRNY